MTAALPKLWLTRSLPAAYKSAEVWARAGFACAISPLLTTAPPNHALNPPPKDATLVFTSGNGLRYFTEYSDSRAHAVITVGDATEKAARDAGFKTVTSANGTSADVTQLIKEKIPLSETIIHCSGSHSRGSITEDLIEAGYTARRDIYYCTVPVSHLPNIEKFDYIALYSPLAAQTLMSFSPDISGKTVISISAATDAELGNSPARRFIAQSPNEAAMLALLREA